MHVVYVCTYVLCMYVCTMYICLYVCTNVCTNVCMYECMVRTYVHMYVLCMYVCTMYVCMYYVCMYVCTLSSQHDKMQFTLSYTQYTLTLRATWLFSVAWKIPEQKYNAHASDILQSAVYNQ